MTIFILFEQSALPKTPLETCDVMDLTYESNLSYHFNLNLSFTMYKANYNFTKKPVTMC